MCGMRVEIIIILLFGLIIGIALLFGTDIGIRFVHKHTNIICSYQYSEKYGTWNFQSNSTDIINFIKDCENRGYHKK